MKPPAHAAFTLIELLVVICIIAILIALIVPNAAKAIESAQASKCAGNLRNIGAGLIAFAGDHDGNFPIAGADVKHGSRDGMTNEPGWTEQIEPYLGTGREIYRCVSCGRLHPENQIYSYFMGARAAFEASDGSFAALKLTRIDKPSRYVLGGDISIGSPFTRDDADKDDYTQNPAFGGEVEKLHRGMANILFADGSVRPFKEYERDEMEISYTDPDETY
jgi:prepilin-type N-terminal cleavage/methylation domain-containing protein/prepilin-type processing-associated H-X9-DG protein